MQKKSPIKNENGSVIILAMIFLVLLTIIGMSAVDTSIIEVQISGNDVRYKTNLYRAEGAAMECAQIIETETNPSFLHPQGTNSPTWMYPNNVFDLSDSVIMASRDAAGELGVSNVHSDVFLTFQIPLLWLPGMLQVSLEYRTYTPMLPMEWRLSE